jgi:hypothetical protein
MNRKIFKNKRNDGFTCQKKIQKKPVSVPIYRVLTG